jgi:membrane-associated phospholipid phosphatase
MYTSLALGQAVITSLLVTSTYKAITGRKPPEDKYGTKADYSKDFNFGFMRRGIFEGWPSGHTTNAFAMATVLWEMYPDNGYIKFYSGAYAFFIGLSISTNIHWFSDFVAGALIGYSIGKSIGQSFRNLADGKKESSGTHLILTPNSLRPTLYF